ncbi:MAG: putative DNA binding domain-containing protein [Spirochaetales bacterium]|nr:putative DNA binding domain-containing protein [Spirochaetales bacterium]
MNTIQIKEILKQGEGLNTEFKETSNNLPSNLFETVCSFLNTDGGIILLGVADNARITGINPDKIDQLMTELANLSNNPQKLEVPYLLFPKKIEIDGKFVIALQVPLSSQLHKTGGKIFLRSEDGDYHIKGMEQLAGIINRKLSLFSEQRTQRFVTVDDLKPELFDKARRLIHSYNSHHPWIRLSNEELLRIGGFFNNDPETGKEHLTLAAVLLFGNDIIIQRSVPAYKIDCLLRHHDLDRYDDRLTIRTNLIDAYDLMMEFVEKHINDPFYLEGDMRISLRDKIFREAISNIISHRDYISASPGRLILYKDKAVLDNPCTQHFFGEITLNNLQPYSHNPTICKFMIQLGRFDELGSGVRNINKYLPLYSKGAKPTFKENGQLFVLTLPFTNRNTPPVTPPVAPPVTPPVKKLLELLAEFGESGSSTLRDQLNLKDRTYVREAFINPALEQKLIERTIPDKPNSRLQKYRLTELGKKYTGEIK